MKLARQLRHWVAEPSPCSYLRDRDASLEYRVMLDVSPEELERLLERGWRRFGVAYFRPRCRTCSECVPLRIPVRGFRASRQQKRSFNRSSFLRVAIGAPTVDEERLRLYRAWHRMQGEARGWGPERMTEEEYFYQFAFPHPAVREFAYYDDAPRAGRGPRLVAVSIVDETPNALSAVYTYHDPEYRRLSLGTASILFQVRVADRTRKQWVYLGYRVLGCMSSEYKARFRPHELLEGWPSLEESPRWVRVDDRAPAPSGRRSVHD